MAYVTSNQANSNTATAYNQQEQAVNHVAQQLQQTQANNGGYDQIGAYVLQTVLGGLTVLAVVPYTATYTLPNATVVGYIEELPGVCQQYPWQICPTHYNLPANTPIVYASCVVAAVTGSI